MLHRIVHTPQNSAVRTVYRTVSEVSAKAELKRITDMYDAGGWSVSLSEDGRYLYAVTGLGPANRSTTEYRIHSQD